MRIFQKMKGLSLCIIEILEHLLQKCSRYSKLFTVSSYLPVKQQSQYNMRNYSYFAMPRAKTVNHGLESFLYIGSKLWDSIHTSHMKEISFINEFKHVIKTGRPDLCSCRFLKVYLRNIGYLQKAKKNTYVYQNTYMSREIRISESSFPVCLTLYIYFFLFSYLLESMEFV